LIKENSKNLKVEKKVKDDKNKVHNDNEKDQIIHYSSNNDDSFKSDANIAVSKSSDGEVF